MDCRVPAPRPLQKEPVVPLERRPWKRCAATRRWLRSPGGGSFPGARSAGCWPRPSVARRPVRSATFLRRERIYFSMIASWRKQVGVADQTALAPKRRGPKPDASARQIQQLQRDNARLRHKLERADLIIAAQKTLGVALGLPTAGEA